MAASIKAEIRYDLAQIQFTDLQEILVKKEQLYHQIAHACLQVLKTPKADSKEQIKAVYDSIDQAFMNQSALLSSELEDCKNRLQLIADLNESEHSLKDAIDIAAQDSAKH